MVKMLLNKKAGAFGSGILFIVLVVYFFIFILVVSSSEKISALAETNDTIVTINLGNVEFDAIIGSSFCTDPRYYYNAETGEKKKYNLNEYDRLFCEESVGILSQDICDDISGCKWENVTSGWWFWKTVEDASCIGNINSTYYGIAQTTVVIGRPRIESHNNTGVWAIYTPFSDPSACQHPNVIRNKTLCDMFSCSWTPVTPDSSFKSVGNVYSTMSDVFSFRYDFGFANQGLSLFMNFIFIVLPLLILIVSLYFMIPFFH